MTETEPIPVAVIGAGSMGWNHIRVYDELPEARLVEVVEVSEKKAAEVRESYNVEVLSSVDDIRKAEAATIAVPTRLHQSVAESCLSAGLDILVEKPLAKSVQAARDIVEMAEKNDAIVQVGHIERFNPAVRVLRDILTDQELISIEAHRLGPFSEQLSEESVVFDLMIHDIDIITMLAGSEIGAIDAMGVTKRSDRHDHAVAQFYFEDNIIGVTTASHVTHGKIRTLRVITREAYIELDYQKQHLQIQRRGTEKTTELLDKSGYVSETITETPYIKTREPLKNELEHFLGCVATRESPEVNGEVGLRAVTTATEIVTKIA